MIAVEQAFKGIAHQIGKYSSNVIFWVLKSYSLRLTTNTRLNTTFIAFKQTFKGIARQISKFSLNVIFRVVISYKKLNTGLKTALMTVNQAFRKCGDIVK